MTITLSTSHKKQILPITNLLNQKIKELKKKEGVCIVFIKHTTACVTTADLDPGTDLDMLDAFEAIMPKLNYRHPHNPAHVVDHILASMIGPSVAIPISNGQLDLGTWQEVVLIELDGPRERTITMSLL